MKFREPTDEELESEIQYAKKTARIEYLYKQDRVRKLTEKEQSELDTERLF